MLLRVTEKQCNVIQIKGPDYREVVGVVGDKNN